MQKKNTPCTRMQSEWSLYKDYRVYHSKNKLILWGTRKTTLTMVSNKRTPMPYSLKHPLTCIVKQTPQWIFLSWFMFRVFFVLNRQCLEDDCITTLLTYESDGSHVDIRHGWVHQNFIVYMYVNYFPMCFWIGTGIISLTWIKDTCFY